MYEYLKGLVTAVSPYYVVLEVQGVGYQLQVANPYRYTESTTDIVQIYVYQAVRDTDITLFGFYDLDEKQIFQKLISVSGIGPKSALAILANSDHSGLIQAIMNDDVSYLTKFPGVGKKTAQQIVLDLKGKLGDLEQTETIAGQTAIELAFVNRTSTSIWPWRLRRKEESNQVYSHWFKHSIISRIYR